MLRRKDATEDMIVQGNLVQGNLYQRLQEVYLKREKTDVLKHALTLKNEKVAFCELSNIQKKIYQRLLSLADYKLLRFAKSPCTCGVNRTFFEGYRLLTSR